MATVNISKEVTLSIFNSLPKATILKAATENYEKILKEEAIMSLAEEVKYQIERASRSGRFSTVVEINYKISTWSPTDLRCYMKSILMDLGYKVRFPDDKYCKFIIEW